ncbi:MAG: prepilin-type N-terminal cleavage/methylation domain-containing protein [Nitrospinota bacterium]|nr:prepilin-type N-terminal cleavage/methylation domain-containing protein [Nitrospinota bacterium]
MPRNEKGFTLLEVIVSLTILALSILSLIQMFSGGLNQASQSDRYMTAVYLAQQKITQLELDSFKTELAVGEFENQEGYSWQLEILPYESQINNEEAGILLQKISLRVFWVEKGQEKEVQLVSLQNLGETRVASMDQLASSSPSSNPFKPKPIENIKTKDSRGLEPK